ncbi:response regulator transcription factor [Pseudothauera nasutitermitis]|nr:response regulator [Pseudothauera nasutitermitis]
MNALRIAIIDDDPHVRTGLGNTLDALGHRADGFDSATTFRDGANPCDYDAILLDFFMPGLNGLDLLRHFADTGVDTPVIMINAGADGEVGHQAHELGSVQWLPKPVRQIPLIEALNRSQEIRAARRSAGMASDDIGAAEISRLEQITTAEWKVLRLLVKDLSSKAIARELGISDRTVHSHRESIYHKLDTRSTVRMYRLLCAAGRCA